MADTCVDQLFSAGQVAHVTTHVDRGLAEARQGHRYGAQGKKRQLIKHIQVQNNTRGVAVFRRNLKIKGFSDENPGCRDKPR